jgi:ubiquitin-conjugating enzyme E2 H
LTHIFDVFLPQLLLYPNPKDPLNSEAADMLLKTPKQYEEKVKNYVKIYAKDELYVSENKNDEKKNDSNNNNIVNNGTDNNNLNIKKEENDQKNKEDKKDDNNNVNNNKNNINDEKKNENNNEEEEEEFSSILSKPSDIEDNDEDESMN